jgi:hypothetical protein
MLGLSLDALEVPPSNRPGSVEAGRFWPTYVTGPV